VSAERVTEAVRAPELDATSKAIGESAANVVDAYWRRLCAIPGMPEDTRLALAVAFQRDYMARVERMAERARAGTPAPVDWDAVARAVLGAITQVLSGARR